MLNVLTAYGVPELTEHFCRLDDLAMQALPSSIAWSRTTTLGRGGELCDFCWSRTSVVLGRFGLSRRQLVDRLEPAGRVLEVSIGPGPNLPYLFERREVDEVFGLDISLGQLQRCQAFCGKQGWSVDLFLGLAEALPFQADSFDRVLHFGGINFFTDKRRAVEEIIRVARPGAKLVVSDETEKVARVYDRTIPGFSGAFEGKRESVRAPVELVPQDMQDLRLDLLWRGACYCIEFRKPAAGNVTGRTD